MKHKNTNKTQFLDSNYHTYFSRSRVTFGTRNGPSTQLINATSCVKMRNATIGAEKLAIISSYQMLSADKNLKSY
jgi:hypothetical protein